MPDITVKNIPDELYNKVSEQAKANHRSINSEIIACLEQSVQAEQYSADYILQEARRMRRKVKGCLSAQEITKAIKKERL